MTYKNVKIKIPLCKTDAKYYTATKDAEIVIVDNAKECLAHYADLNQVTCLRPLCEKCGNPVTARGRYTYNVKTKEQHWFCSVKCSKEAKK